MKANIRTIQATLNVAVDGIAGPITWAAIQQRLLGEIASSTVALAIKAVQKKIGVSVDGIAGPVTWGRLVDLIAPPSPHASATDRVDDRSEGNIATLLPEVRPYARSLVKEAEKVGITIKVIGGTRTYAEQNALYAKGRTAPGSVVTNARGGYSNHNFGIAFDIGVFEGAAYITSGRQYAAVGALGRAIGLEWGGDWKSFKDEPHFQLRPRWAAGWSESAMLAELRRRNEVKQPVFS
ncbi:MAG TPA: M15 family metallopeptidase [Chthoniobacteraceae bacterium]|nr:M15 family metallopeptidase [Chthoniobacteraceae bacterium]